MKKWPTALVIKEQGNNAPTPWHNEHRQILPTDLRAVVEFWPQQLSRGATAALAPVRARNSPGPCCGGAGKRPPSPVSLARSHANTVPYAAVRSCAQKLGAPGSEAPGDLGGSQSCPSNSRSTDSTRSVAFAAYVIPNSSIVEAPNRRGGRSIGRQSVCSRQRASVLGIGPAGQQP